MYIVLLMSLTDMMIRDLFLMVTAASIPWIDVPAKSRRLPSDTIPCLPEKVELVATMTDSFAVRAVPEECAVALIMLITESSIKMLLVVMSLSVTAVHCFIFMDEKFPL